VAPSCDQCLSPEDSEKTARKKCGGDCDLLVMNDQPACINLEELMQSSQSSRTSLASSPEGHIFEAVHVVLVILFAYFFKTKVVDKMPKVTKYSGARRERQVGLFDCFQKQDVCLHAACCLPPTSAKVMHQTDIMGYWPGCVATACTSHPVWPPLMCLGAIFRFWVMTTYQDYMGFESDIGEAAVVACCCWPCEVGRQTLEVDAETGMAATCVCQVKESQAFLPVGDAGAVAEAAATNARHDATSARP